MSKQLGLERFHVMSIGSRFHNYHTVLEILSFFRFQSSCENAPCICGKGCRPLNHKSDNECECFYRSSEKACEKLGSLKTFMFQTLS